MRKKRGDMVSREPRAIMGYTVTDTVSCRLLPSQIAELRELAATEEVSLSRFIGGLCLATIQARERDHTQTESPDTNGSTITRKDDLGG